MKDKQTKAMDSGTSQKPSPLELIRMMGGRSRRVDKPAKAAPDSMLAVYSDRLTYTFILDEEVASIHFDRARKEIFFSGHNISHMELTPRQKEALAGLIGVLRSDEQGREFLSDYSATLDRQLADK